MKSRLTGHIPPGQFLRYLLVGGWNTVFGYTCFFLMNRWLTTVITAYPYLVTGLPPASSISPWPSSAISGLSFALGETISANGFARSLSTAEASSSRPWR